MDNMAEGFERRGTKEFIQFVLDRNHLTRAQCTIVPENTTKISRLVNGLQSIYVTPASEKFIVN